MYNPIQMSLAHLLILIGIEEVQKTKMAANMVTMSTDVDGGRSAFSHTRKFPVVLKNLLTNFTFVFSSLAIIGECVIGVGYTAFGPKYIENQFSIPSSEAALRFGKTVSMVLYSRCPHSMYETNLPLAIYPWLFC